MISNLSNVLSEEDIEDLNEISTGDGFVNNMDNVNKFLTTKDISLYVDRIPNDRVISPILQASKYMNVDLVIYPR